MNTLHNGVSVEVAVNLTALHSRIQWHNAMLARKVTFSVVVAFVFEYLFRKVSYKFRKNNVYCTYRQMVISNQSVSLQCGPNPVSIQNEFMVIQSELPILLKVWNLFYSIPCSIKCIIFSKLCSNFKRGDPNSIQNHIHIQNNWKINHS